MLSQGLLKASRAGSVVEASVIETFAPHDVKWQGPETDVLLLLVAFVLSETFVQMRPSCLPRVTYLFHQRYLRSSHPVPCSKGLIGSIA